MAKNLYADMEMFRREFTTAQQYDESDAVEIERVLETGARRIDGVTDRHFFNDAAIRYFDGTGLEYIRIPDLCSVSTIKLDEDSDRTYELTLNAATDYYLEREFYEDTSAKPKTVLRLDAYNGQRSVFACQKRLVEINGVWGYTDATETVAGTCTLADASTPVMTTTNPGVVAVGQTLHIDAEDVYVQSGAGMSWQVERAVNGTIGAGHSAKAMARYVYHPNIRQANLIIAGRMWKRRDTSYANVIANPIVGTFETFRRTDPDVAELLEQFVRVLV